MKLGCDVAGDNWLWGTIVQKFKLRCLAVPTFLASTAMVFGVLTAASTPAVADESVRSASVLQRSRPDYEPVGARIGSFFLYPYFSQDVFYDDNVFAVANNELSDAVFETTAAAQVMSDWSRHFVSLDLGVKNVLYADTSSENHTDFWARSQWRMDVRRDLNLSGALSVEYLHEDRGAGDSPGNAAEPTPYMVYEAALSFNKQFNRMAFQAGINVKHLDYMDVAAIGGGTIDQDNRDRDTYTAVVRPTYEFSPGYRAFGNFEFNIRDGKQNALTPNRDSEGWEARAGIEFEVTRVISGEISLGYLNQEYDNTALRDVSSWAMSGTLLWNPTQLMTVTLNGRRYIAETNFNGASSQLTTLLSAQLDYEIRRNLIASPHISYIIEEYQGNPREDTKVEAGIQVQYLINRYLTANAFYEYTTRDSNIAAFDYDKNVLGGGVKLKL